MRALSPMGQEGEVFKKNDSYLAHFWNTFEYQDSLVDGTLYK